MKWLLWFVLADTSFDLENNALKLPGPIYYETGHDKIKAESDPALAYVKAFLDAKPYITLLRIEVHSDSQGSDDYNQILSEKRALSVARALVGRGIDCKRLIPVGFGETKPIADNRTVEGRAQKPPHRVRERGSAWQAHRRSARRRRRQGRRRSLPLISGKPSILRLLAFIGCL